VSTALNLRPVRSIDGGRIMQVLLILILVVSPLSFYSYFIPVSCVGSHFAVHAAGAPACTSVGRVNRMGVLSQLGAVAGHGARQAPARVRCR